jgi:hypothetical protein
MVIHVYSADCNCKIGGVEWTQASICMHSKTLLNNSAETTSSFMCRRCVVTYNMKLQCSVNTFLRTIKPYRTAYLFTINTDYRTTTPNSKISKSIKLPITTTRLNRSTATQWRST